MVLGSAISVFAKEHIHGLFRSMRGKRLGVLGIFAASAPGIASPLCMYGTIPLAASFSDSGTDISGYDSTLVLTHFEPHDTVGFYGTAAHMASVSTRREDLETKEPDKLMERLAEQGKAAAESLNGPILYIAVLDQRSVGNPAYGGAIAASYDPVSLDQACVDLVNMAEECQSPAARIEDCNGIDTLIHAEQMGWDSRTYAF